MNHDTVRTLLQLLNIFITCGVGVYAWLANRHKVTNQRISDLEADVDSRIDRHSERITRLEVLARAAPTHDDMAKMHEKLNRVAESSSRLEGQIGSLNSNVRLLLSHATQKGPQ